MPASADSSTATASEGNRAVQISPAKWGVRQQYRAAKESAGGGSSGVTPYQADARRRSSIVSTASSDFFSRLVVASGEAVDERVGLKQLGEEDEEEFQNWDFHPYVFRNITAVVFLGFGGYTVTVFNFYRSHPSGVVLSAGG